MKKYFLHLLFIFLGALAGLAILEAALSLYIPGLMFGAIEISSTNGHYRLSENKDLLYVPAPNTGQFNSFGHRGEAFPLERNEKKRMIFMGDSVVEGNWLHYKNRFTDILASQMGPEYELINLGVCGYSFLQEFEYFKLTGLKFSPDIVLWGITYNDLHMYYKYSGEISAFYVRIADSPKNRFYDTYYRFGGRLRNLALSTNTGKLIAYLLMSKSDVDFRKTVEYDIEWERVAGLLKEIKYLSEKRGFNVIFVFLPVNTALHREELLEFRNIIKENGFSIIDLESIIHNKGKPDRSLFHYGADPCHLSKKGSKATADALYKALKSNGLL